MSILGEELKRAHRHACHDGRVDPACLECEGFASLTAEHDRLAETLRLRSEALDRVLTENERLREVVARVESLVEEWEARCQSYRGTGNFLAQRNSTDELRVSLTGVSRG